MRKTFVLFLSCVCLLVLFTGCITPNAPSTPNANRPSVMVDDILYCSTGKEIPVKIDESEFSGTITSTVSIKQMPTKNDQTNIPFQDAPYAKYEKGIVVLMDEVWILFEAQD